MASIVKRGNSFCVVYSYTSENGERKQKWETFHNNEDALKRKKEIEYKQSIGKFKAPSCTTLDDLLAEYVELYGKNKWAMFCCLRVFLLMSFLLTILLQLFQYRH